MIESWKLSLLCVTAVTVIALPLAGQTSAPSRLSRVPQTSNAGSQMKRTVSDEATAIAAAASVPVSGKFLVKFTIKLVTVVPAGDKVGCSVTAVATDINTTAGTLNNEVTELASTPATVSGTQATCTVSLPYSWYLSNAANDTAELTYTVEIGNTTTGLLTRYATQFVPGAGALKVPANGVTTSFSVNATL